MKRPIIAATMLAAFTLSGCHVLAPEPAPAAAPAAAPIFVAPSEAGVEPAGAGRRSGGGGGWTGG